MNNRLDKKERMIAQIFVSLFVLVAGLIALGAVSNAYYFQPTNIFSMLIPALSEGLMNIWSLGVSLILILQSLVILAIGLMYLSKHWLSIENGDSTYKAEIVNMIIVLLTFLAIVLTLFRATSLAGGSSPVGVLVPLTITGLGTVQVALAVWVFGPRYDLIMKKS